MRSVETPPDFASPRFSIGLGMHPLDYLEWLEATLILFTKLERMF